ncbi:MAG: glycyl-radical enzyme activating protein [Pseudomonadota bacterium]
MTKGDQVTGIVFDIQRFSLHDGPGIRTTVFFKGCPLRCAWCQNPEALSAEPEMAFYADRCQGCFQCAAVCPEAAIVKDPHRRIDEAVCTACGLCAAVCPEDAIRHIGRAWTAGDLATELLKDRDFFTHTGGGVTLSGGEPMQQWPFLSRLLPQLKAEGIHVTLETSGLFQWEHITPLLEHLDLVYCDLKHMDDAIHRRITGGGNSAILTTFARLSETAIALTARMPVIPGMNDAAANIRATAALLKRCGHERIILLPYHRLGEAKLPRLNTRQRPLHLESPGQAALSALCAAFEKAGIHATVSD